MKSQMTIEVINDEDEETATIEETQKQAEQINKAILKHIVPAMMRGDITGLELRAESFEGLVLHLKFAEENPAIKGGLH